MMAENLSSEKNPVQASLKKNKGMRGNSNQLFYKKLRAIFSVRTFSQLATRNYTNYWIPAKKGIGIARIGYIRITSRILWGFVFATHEHEMKPLRF